MGLVSYTPAEMPEFAVEMTSEIARQLHRSFEGEGTCVLCGEEFDDCPHTIADVKIAAVDWMMLTALEKAKAAMAEEADENHGS